jgi:organic radical activating enzyme
MSTYLVKEMFGPTLQGEGAHAGRPCVFLRFAACNLACSWCDTDFAPEGAEELTADAIVTRLLTLDAHKSRMVVVTGGEPTLQWDDTLAQAIKSAGFQIHMESNGIRPLRAPVDWLTLSPKTQFHKPGQALAERAEPQECKVVVDDTVDDGVLAHLEARYPRCANWFLQPCDDAAYAEHLKRSLAMVTSRPRWRLSLQLHKILGVP